MVSKEELESMPRSELQKKAKELGVRANLKSSEMISLILSKEGGDKGEEKEVEQKAKEEKEGKRKRQPEAEEKEKVEEEEEEKEVKPPAKKESRPTKPATPSSEQKTAANDIERMYRAFAELEKIGIICRANWCVTPSEGDYEINREMQRLRDEGHKVVGQIFFHRQNKEMAIRGAGLFINFGNYKEGQPEDKKLIAVGIKAATELEKAGLSVSWNCSVAASLYIKYFKWDKNYKKRYTVNKNPGGDGELDLLEIYQEWEKNGKKEFGKFN